jgi:hypothetical protein
MIAHASKVCHIRIGWRRCFINRRLMARSYHWYLDPLTIRY